MTKKTDDIVEEAVKKNNKEMLTLTEEQEALAPEIQKIVQEEMQQVLIDFQNKAEEYTEKQIHNILTLRVSKRVVDELGIDLGY